MNAFKVGTILKWHLCPHADLQLGYTVTSPVKSMEQIVTVEDLHLLFVCITNI